MVGGSMSARASAISSNCSIVWARCSAISLSAWLSGKASSHAWYSVASSRVAASRSWMRAGGESPPRAGRARLAFDEFGMVSLFRLRDGSLPLPQGLGLDDVLGDLLVHALDVQPGSVDERVD